MTVVVTGLLFKLVNAKASPNNQPTAILTTQVIFPSMREFTLKKVDFLKSLSE